MTQKHNVHWFKRFLMMVGFLILVLVANSLALLGLNFSLFIPQLPSLAELALNVLGLGLAFLIIHFIKRQYQSWSSHGSFQMTGRDLGYAFLYLVIGRLIIIGFAYLMEYFSGESTTANDAAIMAMMERASLSSVISLGIAVIVVAPLVEEFVFRGLFKEMLFPRHKWLSLIVGSLVFSSFHMSTNFWSFFIYFALGLLFCLAYYRRMNIYDAVLLHALNNIVGFIGLLMYRFQ